MTVSLTTQLAALKAVSELRPEQIVRAGLAPRAAHAELIRTQLVAAFKTFEHVASDERIRRYVEKVTRDDQH